MKHVASSWFACASVALCATPAVYAQSAEELATRRLLIDQATAAATNGDHARALDLAERADRLQSTPSIRLFIALRQEALGRFVAAVGSAEQCHRGALRDASTPNRAQLIEQCSALSTRARGRAAVVEFRIVPSVPVELTINGATVSAALVGAPQLVDPGAARVRVTSPGFDPWERSFDIASATTTPITVELVRTVVTTPDPQRTRSAASSSGGGASTTSTTASTNVTTPVRPPVTRVQGPGAGPWIVAGAGAAVMGSAALFFALRNGALSNCTVSADEIVCASQDDARRVLDSAYTFNTLTNVSLVAGAAVIAGGALWFALAPRRTVVVAALPSSNGAAIVAGGRF